MSDIEVQLPFDLPMLPVERLRAGDISCWYERGNIRYLVAGGEEVVRMIYPAVRNSSWATASYEIEEEKRNIREDFFEISYTAIYFLDELHYRARITITGKQDSSIVFAMDGESLSTFKSNRIGLCVLHPVTTCKGKKHPGYPYGFIRLQCCFSATGESSPASQENSGNDLEH